MSPSGKGKPALSASRFPRWTARKETPRSELSHKPFRSAIRGPRRTPRPAQPRKCQSIPPGWNEIVGGVLGQAQAQIPVRCHAAVFLSTHFHLLLSVDDAQELAEFMRYLNTNLSLEINRLYDRRGAVWGSRYKAILVSQEEAAQAGRFRYVLAHGLKRRPCQYRPGIGLASIACGRS
jgi:hypothetical protein